ncbi:DUF6207 family protein [Streptomyces sp. JV185]|uniref:DUF6207 family protein n=1 Tax=Streptomyces sp. JV185 TaxID=858638 RepID=UPI002E76D9F5|nr:DUF6207 family protein [Streptomyces sp. JV185]MEE1766684.1 DUF6207 family protein [Streptomyces sp. JV185]
MKPIDTQHISEPGLVVLDITGGDEDTVRAVMTALEERWATSSISPVRRKPGAPGTLLVNSGPRVTSASKTRLWSWRPTLSYGEGVDVHAAERAGGDPGGHGAGGAGGFPEGESGDPGEGRVRCPVHR